MVVSNRQDHLLTAQFYEGSTHFFNLVTADQYNFFMLYIRRNKHAKNGTAVNSK